MRGLSAVPATTTPTRTSRSGRVASMSSRGFSTGAGEGDHAAVDAELLAVGLVGAVDRAQRAVDGEPAARRGEVQLAAQAGIEAAAADAQLLAHADAQVERDLAAAGAAPGRRRRTAGALAAGGRPPRRARRPRRRGRSGGA